MRQRSGNRTDTNHLSVQLSTGKELVKARKFAEALSMLEMIVEANVDPTSHFLLAVCLTAENQLDRALEVWDEAIKRQPSSMAVSYNKGLTYILKDQWDAALSQLERAALLDPADLDCQLLLGGCRVFAGDLERSWENFDFLIETDASREEAYAFRGFARLLQGRSADAVTDLLRSQKAIDVKLLGDGFMAEGDPRRALHYYQTAQKLQADFPNIAALIKVAQDLPSAPPALPPRPGSGSGSGVRMPGSPGPTAPDGKVRSRRNLTDSPLRQSILAEITSRLAKQQRLKLETQQLVVWQWRKVLFGEEEMMAKVPYDIVRLGTTLMRDHIDDEGIFRLAASGALVQYSFRKIQFGESETVDLRPSYLCANLLGRYAKSLKTKFNAQHLREWGAVASGDVAKQTAHLQKLLGSLSPFHRVILHYYVDLWAAVVDHSDKNRMTARNIANVMAPNFIEDSLCTDLGAINGAVSLIIAMITHRAVLFTESIAGHLSSADDAWENFSADTSDSIELAFQRGVNSHTIKINGADYEVQFQMLLQLKVSDRNRQRPVRRRVLHHDQTTFSVLQVVDESPERPDGSTTLRTAFDVLSLLPKTVKSPHYASPMFPGTDCLICPWPIPVTYQLESFLGAVFMQSALSYNMQHFLCGPPAYSCWLVPTFQAQCRFVLFVRYGGGEGWSPYEGLKAAFHFIRVHNVQNRANKEQEIKSVTLRPFEQTMTLAHFKQMGLAYSELFTSSSTTRQVLCGIRSLESC